MNSFLIVLVLVEGGRRERKQLFILLSVLALSCFSCESQFSWSHCRKTSKTCKPEYKCGKVYIIYCIDSAASLLHFFLFPIYHLQYYHNPQTLACLDRLDVIPVVIFIIQFSCSCQTTLTVLLRQFDLPIKGIMIRINLDHFYQQFTLIGLSEAVPKQLTLSGVSNGPIQFKSARKIWSLLELLAKITRVLACSFSQNFCNCWHARILVNTCSIARNFVNSAL